MPPAIRFGLISCRTQCLICQSLHVVRLGAAAQVRPWPWCRVLNPLVSAFFCCSRDMIHHRYKRLVIGKGRDVVGCICMLELKRPHGPQSLFTSRVGLGNMGGISHLGEQIGPELLSFIPRRPDCLGPFSVSRSSITTALPLLPAINGR
jgi:hypothetical protein